MEPWFVTEAGVISLSLRNMTVLMSTFVTVALFSMCYYSCTYEPEYYTCTVQHWPMISDVINQEMYTRVFILMMTVFMFGVNLANVRAFFKKVYDAQGGATLLNDITLGLGLVSSGCLPLIGVFDESKWSQVHGFFAGVYFLTFMAYGFLVGYQLNACRDKIPQSEQADVTRTYYHGWGLVIATFMFLGHMAIYHKCGPTAILEWVCVIYQINFFAVAAQENQFYDSVYAPTTVTNKKV